MPPAGRCPIAQQWHDIGEMPSRKNRPKIRMGARRNVATQGKMTRRAGVAWRKGHIIGKNQTRRNIARGALTGLTFGKRLQVDLEVSTGVKDQHTRWQLQLENERTASQTLSKNLRLDITKRAVEISNRL